MNAKLVTILLILEVAALQTAVHANVQCYTCTACSDTFTRSENSVSTSCIYCGKTKSVNAASRTCLDTCTKSVDSDGNGLYCCNDKDLCNSASGTKSDYRGLMTGLLGATATAVVGRLIATF
ncbi:hypothetical protein BOX15_Mlig008030g1 [Macrostomum lignano]|uniref:Snake toxin/toxin-like domain-containing protein n=1 Tax=Macrostomum lignano TaxID=282301 RepID=A0A267G048_9PLAT|nr:hypothetical protein BOX15_Mlig012958g1 [Macrostomum lignano]PAA78707.1 hypothetical protein BOX15_Mlig008030g1 [Macrostomum lignano]